MVQIQFNTATAFDINPKVFVEPHDVLLEMVEDGLILPFILTYEDNTTITVYAPPEHEGLVFSTCYDGYGTEFSTPTFSLTLGAGSQITFTIDYVLPAVEITTQPEDIYILAGDENGATFSVVANGSDLRYQWYKDEYLPENEIAFAVADSYTTFNTDISNNGSFYICKVYEFTDVNNFEISNAGKLTIEEPIILLPPSNLNSLERSDSSIDLTWDIPLHANTAYRYYIYRSNDNVNFTEITNVDYNVASYTDTSLNPDTIYYYKMNTLDVVLQEYSELFSNTTSSITYDTQLYTTISFSNNLETNDDLQYIYNIQPTDYEHNLDVAGPNVMPIEEIWAQDNPLTLTFSTDAYISEKILTELNNGSQSWVVGQDVFIVDGKVQFTDILIQQQNNEYLTFMYTLNNIVTLFPPANFKADSSTDISINLSWEQEPQNTLVDFYILQRKTNETEYVDIISFYSYKYDYHQAQLIIIEYNQQLVQNIQHGLKLVLAQRHKLH